MPHPVEVVEGGSELVELFLADAFGVAGQDLVLHLVDGSGDGGEQLLPAHADVLRWREERGMNTWTKVTKCNDVQNGQIPLSRCTSMV